MSLGPHPKTPGFVAGLIALMALVIAILAFCSRPAEAASCAPRERVLERLGAKYGEVEVARGFTPFSHGEVLMQWFVNPETGTCTVIQTTPDGTTCIVTHCTGFEAVKPAAAVLPPNL